jgi:hypothetical protein
MGGQPEYIAARGHAQQRLLERWHHRAHLGGAQYEVVLRPGHSYTLGGWMRGERMQWGAMKRNATWQQ